MLPFSFDMLFSHSTFSSLPLRPAFGYLTSTVTPATGRPKPSTIVLVISTAPEWFRRTASKISIRARLYWLIRCHGKRGAALDNLLRNRNVRPWCGVNPSTRFSQTPTVFRKRAFRRPAAAGKSARVPFDPQLVQGTVPLPRPTPIASLPPAPAPTHHAMRPGGCRRPW